MGSNTPKPNRPDRLASLQKLIDGVNKHASAIPSLMILGAAMTPAQIVTAVQAIVATAQVVTTTRAAWQNAVKADHTERQNTKTFVSGLKQALLVAFAGQIDVLADFGLTPRKPPVRTPEQKQAAAAKAKATRAARHTMGKKQKAKVTGTTAQTQSPPPAGSPAPAATTAAQEPAPPAPAAPTAPAEPPTPQKQ